MQNKETIQLVLDEHSMELEHEQERVIGVIIKHARKLNEYKDESVGKCLPGTEFLHGMLQEGMFSNDLYQQLKRLAEDPLMEYEFKTIME
jgi:hypothetical protein